MVVQPGVVWTYIQRVYGRTALGGKDVRAEVAWTYVQRTFERWRTEVNEMCVDSTDSEQFLNGNETGTTLAFPLSFLSVFYGRTTWVLFSECSADNNHFSSWIYSDST